MKLDFEKIISAGLHNERIIVNVVNVLLIVLLAFALDKLTWRLFSDSNNNSVGVVGAGQQSIKQVEPSARLRTISDLHLFGKTDVVEKVDAPIVAPETRLQLKLKGVFASSNPEKAFAIISDNKNKDKSYKLGNKIIGGAVLHAVYKDRVILKRNGRLETLRMSTKYDTSGIKTTTVPSTTSKKSGKRVVKAPQKLKQLRETLLREPQKVWQQVRVSPVLKNGSIKGYTVEHKDEQLMKSLNLQKGDVITSINGKPLSDPSSLYGLMNQLKNNQSLEVTIERNNQVEILQLQM